MLKRIRRHIQGPVHSFFAVCPPGLEDLCQADLKMDGTLPEGGGGVEFTARLPGCYEANLHSRIATRILMRISQFHAADFRTLQTKLNHIPWELYLPKNYEVSVQVSTRHCRIHHSGAISEYVQHAVQSRLESGSGENPEQTAAQRVFVRAVDDRFTLSLDSSGEALYRRGIKTRVGSAPLRETLAAAVLHLVGYTGDEPLLDPMCGSGSFSIEAAMKARNIPAGWLRSFAFFDWPGFRPSQWTHIRREAEKRFGLGSTPEVLASDTSQTAVRQLDETIQNHPFLDCIRTQTVDFFDIHPTRRFKRPGLVVLNPPYGLRMGNPAESRVLHTRILDKLASDFRGWKAALITPFPIPARSRDLRLALRPILHGGLRLHLYTGRIE